jgi:hypothetical protein
LLQLLGWEALREGRRCPSVELGRFSPKRRVEARLSILRDRADRQKLETLRVTSRFPLVELGRPHLKQRAENRKSEIPLEK